MLCINTGKFRTDTSRMRMDGNQYYLRSPEEMYAGVSRTTKMPWPAARRSPIRSTSIWNLGQRHFPTYRAAARRNGRSSTCENLPAGTARTLRRRRRDVPGRRTGAAGDGAAGSRTGSDQQAGISQLLSHRVGLCARSARAGNSGHGPRQRRRRLVCYALYLSHVCPIKYDLLFERFLDESRLEAPDIDIDFCKERRGDIIRYVKDKYGEANVAQIGTFRHAGGPGRHSRCRPRSGHPSGRVNQVTQMVPEELGITLDKALEKSDDLTQRLRQ